MSQPNPHNLTCEICNGESGSPFVGVASIPGVPMSIAWCAACLQHDCAPTFVFEHDFIFVAEGDLDKLHEWALDRMTWSEGRYMGFREYVQRFTPEIVAQKLAEFEVALARIPDEDL